MVISAWLVKFVTHLLELKEILSMKILHDEIQFKFVLNPMDWFQMYVYLLPQVQLEDRANLEAERAIC